MWNRLRYTVWAPIYDTLAGAVGFDAVRRESIARLGLREGHRLLVVGAGTGLDLPHVPRGVQVAAVDVTPAMVRRFEMRAARLGIAADARVADARDLPWAEASFDAAILHLVLSVMPAPEIGLREVARVVQPGGRVAVFDKFLGEHERPSARRHVLNALAKPLFSDMNRRLEPMVRHAGLVIERDEPSVFGGMYRLVTLSRPRC
ncbi:MAG: methyltransferase domain-containing protein [Acidobacteria bacterium]|nr:methyltransferase domain-containing protein [Acidobacteriota bacterium]